MTLRIHVSYDEDFICTKTVEFDNEFYSWQWGGKTYLFNDYEGVTCDNIELELEGLPDKAGYSRWQFQEDGYQFMLEEPISELYCYDVHNNALGVTP